MLAETGYYNIRYSHVCGGSEEGVAPFVALMYSTIISLVYVFIHHYEMLHGFADV